MKHKSFCNQGRRQRQATERRSLRMAGGIAAVILLCMPRASGSDAPQWMHALVNAPLTTYDEKTEAVLLYSDINVTVISTDKIKTQIPEAYKILRPEGRDHGTVFVHFNPQRKVKSFHGWCIPAQGKDYEVKDKDAIEVSPRIEGAELISDVKYKVLRIPAPDPGNIVGYEYEVEEQPFFLQYVWRFQEVSPVRESHFSLHLPSTWEYKSSWLSFAEVKPTESGSQSQWVISDVKGIRHESYMPAFGGIAGQMIVSFFPPG